MPPDERRLDLLIRLAGLVAWGGGALPLLDPGLRDLVSPGWVACYLLFGAAFLLGTHPPLAPQWTTACAAVLVVSGLCVHLLAPSFGYTGVLFVVAAAYAAFVLPLWAVAAVILLQTAVLVVRSDQDSASTVVSAALTFMCFQAFAVGIVQILERESRARQALAVAHEELELAHAQLSAAQVRLAETSRNAERLRISRDLHDLVGHQLTALAVNLEVAAHVSQGQAREHVELSRSIAKDLLRDVRAAVGRLREAPTSLPAVLRTIGTSVPSPAIHLTVPDDFTMADLDRTEALLRCVQEIITNAVRHAESDNLWIEVSRNEADEAVVSAHDDGRGVRTVQPGNGLTGMAERLEQLGGRLSYTSVEGTGFRVEAALPAGA